MKENPDRKIKKGAKRLKTQDPTKLENITKVQKPHDSPVPPPPPPTPNPPPPPQPIAPGTRPPTPTCPRPPKTQFP